MMASHPVEATLTANDCLLVANALLTTAYQTALEKDAAYRATDRLEQGRLEAQYRALMALMRRFSDLHEEAHC